MSAAVLITWSGDAVLAFSYRRDVVDRLKAEIPAPFRSWEPARKTWTIDAPFVALAIGILETAFGHVAITDERPHVDRGRRDDAGADAYRVLFLQPDAPAPVIDAAYKALARMNHPDAGGDTAAMQAINAAYQEVRS